MTRSIEETGLDLLTFYNFPKAMWKSLRTTNTLEDLNREFRRRTKTHRVKVYSDRPPSGRSATFFWG